MRVCDIMIGYDKTASSCSMKRIQALLQEPLFKACYRRTEKDEENRIFCCHQMPHLLDVARIASITCLENGIAIDREVIYAAALLHDIGKYAQYEEGIPHEEESERIAGQILNGLPEDYAFTEAEKAQILTAVRGHRKLREDPELLEYILYKSDKASRACFACPAEKKCNWDAEKKNMELII